MRNSKRSKRADRKTKIVLALVIVAFCVLAAIYSNRVDENRYDAIIKEKAKKYNIDSRLIKAVIYQESKFDSRARGSHGEIGLMQIMPKGPPVDWAKHYKVENLREGLLFDPATNIEIGTWYLSKALKRWKKYKYSKELALCQYNAGGKRANSWKPRSYDGSVIERIKIKSTRAYVESIMDKYDKYCGK